MPTFLLGAYLIAVGVTGNAGGLLEALAGDGAFIPFAIAVGIGYFAWEETPPPENKPVRILIVAALIAIALSQYARIIAAFQTAWTAVNSLQGGSITGGTSTPATNGVSLTSSGSPNDPGNYLI